MLATVAQSRYAWTHIVSHTRSLHEAVTQMADNARTQRPQTTVKTHTILHYSLFIIHLSTPPFCHRPQTANVLKGGT